MDLSSFLNYALIGAGLIVIFRNFDERPSQYITILCIALAALMLLGSADILPFFAEHKISVIFPVAIGVLSLVILVRVEERSFTLLMLALAVMQLLIHTKFIHSLS